jgi:hypothetical protein
MLSMVPICIGVGPLVFLPYVEISFARQPVEHCIDYIDANVKKPGTLCERGLHGLRAHHAGCARRDRMIQVSQIDD